MFNPFPGLRPFEADEEHLFFGRERETDDLLRRLRTTRFLAVVGTSGSGKSSLVRSGLIPSLQGGYMAGASSSWRIAVMRPGEDPTRHLANALAPRDVLGAGPADDAEVAATAGVLLEATLRRGSRGLVDALKQARIPRDENLLVLVDQFEELFRFRRNANIANSRDESIAFVRLLLEAARQRDQPIFIVLTMRSDFIGDCMDFPGLSDAVNDGLYLVGRMSRDALRSAITGPVAVGGGAIAPRLVHRVLNDLGDNQDQLPLVQHALMRTWDHWAARHRDEASPADDPIDIGDYDAIGSFSGALSRHAEEAFSEVSAAGLAHPAEHIFKSLTDTFNDPRGVRRPTSVAELAAIASAPESDVIRVIETFRRHGRSFLMPPASVPLSSRSIVDISHESLMRCWARLQDWADQERESAEAYMRLSQSATWHRRGIAGLWRNPELELALRWRAETHPTAAWARRYDNRFDDAIAFLDRSNEAWISEQEERERARKSELRRVQWAAAILAAFLVIAVSLGYLTFRERQRAEQNLALAREAVDESLASAERDPAAGKADPPQLQVFRRDLLAKAERFYRAFMNQASGSEAIQRDVALSHFRLGHIDRLLEKRDEAEREYRIAIEQFGRLSQDHRGDISYRASLANAYNWLGETLRPIADRYADAERAYDSAFDLQEGIVRDDPFTAAHRRELARTSYNRGILRSTRNDALASSEADFVRAIGLLEPLASSDRAAAQELARAYNNLGSLVSAVDSRAAESLTWWEKAIATDERLVAQNPDDRDVKFELAIYCANVAASLQDAGRGDAATERSRQARDLLDSVALPTPPVAVAHADAHGLYASIVSARAAATAEEEFRTALTLFTDGARDPLLRHSTDYHLRFGDLLLNLAAFSASPTNGDRGRSLLARGIAAYASIASIEADSAADARPVLETINRVLPSIPERERGPLIEAQRQLQRKVGSR